MSEDERSPMLVIHQGNPTDEEIAALVAVVAARAAQAPTRSPAPPPSQWAAHSRKLRTPQYQRLGGWRAAALPR